MKPQTYNVLGHRAVVFSVTHKQDVEKFARDMLQLGLVILASGGTYNYLLHQGVPAYSIQEYLRESIAYRLQRENYWHPWWAFWRRLWPNQIAWISRLLGRAEMLGHRIAAGLHPPVQGGLLSTLAMAAELEQLGMVRIEVFCGDFYALREAIKKGGDIAKIIEDMDIGGPTMGKASFKGHRVTVLDPADRDWVAAKLLSGEFTDQDRTELNAKALAICLDYYAPLLEHMSGSRYRVLVLREAKKLAYPENRWMQGGQLMTPLQGPTSLLALSQFEQVEGDGAGYINYTDVDGGIRATTRIAAYFAGISSGRLCIAVGLKHGTCCGAAVRETPEEVLMAMVNGNPMALFGGTVMVNFPLDARCAEIIRRGAEGKSDRVLDVVATPAITPDAIERLRRVTRRCRIFVNPALAYPVSDSLDCSTRFRQTFGGEFLVQGDNHFVLNLNDHRLQKFGNFTPEIERDILFGAAICLETSSNTVILVRDQMLVGVGCKKPSRVEAGESAIASSAYSIPQGAEGATAVSDSFFAFVDVVERLIAAGVKAIFTTRKTGEGLLSKTEQRVVELCQEASVPLCWGPDAYFRMFNIH